MSIKRTVQDILQDEVLRERAAVLARAGEQLEYAMERLAKIGRRIAELTSPQSRCPDGPGPFGSPAGAAGLTARLVLEINREIHVYNRQREEVRTRFYYLIVTREAMGLTHHQRLEEMYRLPPRKHCLPER
jgi:hypothetical protein